MSRRIIALICCILTITAASIVLDYCYPGCNWNNVGQLIILALTLVVLIIYAWDTRRIANATEQKWEEELKPKLLYEIIMGQTDKNKVVFRLINPTDYVVEEKVNCNFTIYGQPVSIAAAYDGSEAWVVFPHQVSQGYFNIETILSKKGKNRLQMMQERTDMNEHEQLNMDLEISFESETGRKRKYPLRKHYFSFEREVWMPEIIKRLSTA